MASSSGDRSVHFPAIEKKHGKPIAHWLEAVGSCGSDKYDGQMEFLTRSHGFSRAHANAVVMFARGSTTTRRHESADELLRDLGGRREELARGIFAAIANRHRGLELVVAWNQPMLKHGKHYVFGLSAAKNHLLIATFGLDIVAAAGGHLGDLVTNKKTIRIPLDWVIDAELLDRVVSARLADIETNTA